VSDATILEVVAALATQLDAHLSDTVPGIQVDPLRVPNPTPPCLDLYPGDPSGETIAFDNGQEVGRQQIYTIRARVHEADHQAGQELLLGLMDRFDGSVLAAVYADRTIGGTVDNCFVEGPSGFGFYDDGAGALLGCTWTLTVVL
jgi:hypothetical protein